MREHDAKRLGCKGYAPWLCCAMLCCAVLTFPRVTFEIRGVQVNAVEVDYAFMPNVA